VSRIALACALAACGGGSHAEGTPDAAGPVADAAIDGPVSMYAWQLPPNFPVPLEPAENLMSAEKVELGRRLFYDTRLSGNQTQSCASCHKQELAFTDGLAQAVGSTGQLHPRSAMTLGNVAYLGRFAWANTVLSELETQAVVPMFGAEPVELGMKNMEDTLLARIQAEPIYPPLFAAAFPHDGDPVTVANIVKALCSFERILITGSSPYDRYSNGDATAISDSAKRGLMMFNSEKMECFHCHGGFNFNDVIKYVGHPQTEARFHNTGLYNIGGDGSYPPDNQGIYALTLMPADMGKFRAPTLRNIALTAPYFHDGSAATLDDVLDHYAAAGRTITTGPHAGVGSANPFKDSLLVGFTLNDQERADMHAFFESLTDDQFITDPRFSNPWQ
jgi:cytochrome c peroxidase